MNKVPEAIRKELAALSAKPEEEIDFSDIPETTSNEWQGASRGLFYRPVKKQLTIRIDADVIEWLKAQGVKGYQARMNDILRSVMLSQYREQSVKSK
ncbi:MAG: BrnA antitoxin family protein (plasmid) [Candidatus Symbiodolus clandestinus]